jgi:hypothetical protein
LATHAEIAESRQPNLLEFVRWHRPSWLRGTRGTGPAPAEVKVYLNGAWIGGEDALREIRADFAASVRYVEPLDASARWGKGHEAGAIMIVSMPAMLAASRGKTGAVASG